MSPPCPDRFMDPEIATLRCLMEQQLDRVEAMSERGGDLSDALDLLRKLVERDKAVRVRLLLSEAEMIAAAA